MIISRKEEWGSIFYDTKTHSFSYDTDGPKSIGFAPYAKMPIVLNVDLCFECNMICDHCVAEDMAKELGGKKDAKLKVDKDLINNINKSPFLVLVMTGGEPLLPQNEKIMRLLIKNVKNKGVIIDTNGTFLPSNDLLKLIVKKDILIRISWDIPHPKKEAELRRYPRALYKSDMEYIVAKEENIKNYKKAGVQLAIQTVLHRYNYNNNNLYKFPYKLEQLGVDHWYIQRFIPSHKRKKDQLKDGEYEKRVSRLSKLAEMLGINCHYKRDKRHNSVFLLVKDGDLYTQNDEKAGGKIHIGKLGSAEYFDYVSNSEHNARYMV